MKKSIFLFFAAILCAMSVSAKTIYLNTGGSSLWNQAGAKFGCWTWGSSDQGDLMSHLEGDIWAYETSDANTDVIFTRVQPTSTGIWDKEWNRIQTQIPADKNCCTITGWGASDYSWSVYTPSTPPVTHTFAKNSTLYVDFRAITDKKGANYPKAGTASGLDYSANAGGTVIPVTFTADVKWTEGAEFMKTEKGDWASIPFKAPEAGQNCAQVAADGKSYTWTTYSEPSVTLSLDKTEADAGTEVTVTLTATADNVSGEVTYAFQYSTDNATWNNITATGNTATQTFAAETRYYKVTMTNGGTTKEATAKFSAIKFHVIGSWDSWATHNEVVEGSKTITLEANKTYEYKITNGTWDLSWGNDGTMDRNNCTDWSFESNNNAKIKTDEAGDYVFNVSRNAEGKVKVSVVYPELVTPIPTYDYYIAGTMNSWDKAHVEYGMTDEDADGIYEKEITLAAGQDHQFKVTNGKWGNEDGGFDCATVEGAYEEVSVDGNVYVKLDAETTFTVKFNKNAGKISFEGLTEKAPVVSTYALMGVGGDWTTGITMTVNPDNADEYVLKAQSISSTDAIKVLETAGSTQTWHSTVDAYSNATFELVDDGYGDKNIVLPAGTYNFYFKKINNEIYIEEVYVRDVTNTYGTICLPYASNSYDGAIFYRVAGKETGKVYLESVSELEAGVPYIFEKTASKIVVARNGAPVASADNHNGLHGTFDNDTEVAVGNYILKDNKLCQAADICYVNANRAYLVMSEVLGGAPQPMPGRRYIGMSVQGENEATGVEDLFTTEAPVKVIENGQLIIIRDGVKYNVQGQKL